MVTGAGLLTELSVLVVDETFEMAHLSTYLVLD
jgi:hypothetical protein